MDCSEIIPCTLVVSYRFAHLGNYNNNVLLFMDPTSVIKKGREVAHQHMEVALGMKGEVLFSRNNVNQKEAILRIWIEMKIVKPVLDVLGGMIFVM